MRFAGVSLRSFLEHSVFPGIGRVSLAALAIGAVGGGLLAIDMLGPGRDGGAWAAPLVHPPVPTAKPVPNAAVRPPLPTAKPFVVPLGSTRGEKVAEDRVAVEGGEDKDPILLARRAAPAPEFAPSHTTDSKKVAIGRGDTLVGLLLREGVDRRVAHRAAVAIGEVHDPRRLRPGQQVTLVFDRDDLGLPKLANVRLDADVERSVVARRQGDGAFASEAIRHPLTADAEAVHGTIADSLFRAADARGVPASVTIAMIKLFSFDIDFQRDIQPGDGFSLLYEVFRDASGEIVKTGDILFAELHVGGGPLPLYRFEVGEGEIEYFNDKGESVRKALLKTPVDGARLSSRFGRRRHPILNYTKMHRGVDFAAPRGTPVVAAGKGKIEFVGRKGAYGKYIRIRHNSEFDTAYAHLRGIARGISIGRRVRQGQTIGYVGSTGRSTGPHLHYEVLRASRRINPLGLKLPSGRKLKGKEKRRFLAAQRELDDRYAAATDIPVRLASE